MKCRNLTLLELFAGTGGFALGLARAGFHFSTHYFSEIDEKAIANYKYNFKQAIPLGNVTNIDAKKIKRPDILTFGSPCQDLSVAGKRNGLKGSKSRLFFEAVRVIRESRPRIFIFENVKGLLFSNGGKDFEIVLRTLADIGLYDVQWQLLNTAWFLPQNRERVYLVGSLRGEPAPQVFPIGDHCQTDCKRNEKTLIQANIAPTIDTRVGEQTNSAPYVLAVRGQKQKGGSYTQGTEFRKDKNTNAITGTNKHNLLLQGPWQPLKTQRTEKAKAIRRENQKLGIDHAPFAEKEYTPRRENMTGAIASSSQMDNLLASKTKPLIRRLTPRECERLQGFPDEWTFYGSFNGEIKEISDTQRYKLVGNAVSVPVVEALGKKLLGKPVHLQATLDGLYNETLFPDLKGIHAKYSSMQKNKEPDYYRHRMEVIEDLIMKYNLLLREESDIDRKKAIEKNLRVLRNGVFPEEYEDFAYEYNIPLIEERLANTTFGNHELTFDEITRYNTWFEAHPEKIAGTEWVTTSRDFPISIKGTKQDIIDTIRKGLQTPPDDRMDKKLEKLKADAKHIKQQLLKLKKNMNNNNYALSGLGDDNFFASLGDLYQPDIEVMNKNLASLKEVLQKSQKEKQEKHNDLLSFDDVDKLYNKGISEKEKQAWVWYKRSLGYPMRGWNKYYVNSKAGKEEEVLRTIRDTMIKDNRWQNIQSVKKGTIIGKPTKFTNKYDRDTYLVYVGLDGNKYIINQAHVTREKTGVRVDDELLHQWIKEGVLFYSRGDFLPYPLFAYGNMYDRELQLREDKIDIINMFGEEEYSKHLDLINSLKPKLLTVTNPDPNERPKILSVSKFARNFEVVELRDEAGVVLNEDEEDIRQYSLTHAFEKWLEKLDKHHFNEVTAKEIIDFYINGKNLKKDFSDEHKSTIEKYTRIEGEELFSNFLYEAVTFEDQQKIDFKWNREYNGFSAIPYHRVPIGFECSYKFKAFSLEFTPAQREAIAFMEIAGSGIIAYDVGVGKTMSAIITAANALYSGKCSRPVIVVPNPTYAKWVREIIGYHDKATKKIIPGVLSFTDVTVNEWYNLNKTIAGKIDFLKAVPEKSITVMTYEGLKKIGFSRKVMELLFKELSQILAQAGDEDKSGRDLESKYQKFRELIGMGVKDTIADIDTLGFDYMIIDEAHNFKNVFADVPTDEDGVKRYKITGSQSSRAVKAFFLCNYIQRTFGSNVMLLTATPFTNSPLEIYSMLSLVGHESMRKMGIVSVERFMETFVLQSLEYVNSYDDTIREAPVVKSFNNRLILQKLIHNHIAYKTGEEAGVKRPCKVNLPRINATMPDGSIKRLPNDQQIVTYLRMNQAQRDNQKEIIQHAQQGTVLNGNIMRAMGQSLDNALSPFLYKFNRPPEDYIDYVEGSPKIHYTMECIKSVKTYHENKGEPVSGQVIYMNRGKDYFPYIKEYLEEQLGYKSNVKHTNKSFDEVEIISSGISANRKEAIKDAFLAGIVKIIIGTATIREGIDLQKKGTVVYNLYPDWNPTDIKQLEGRIWRQGNEFGYVRSVMPLVQDSMDVFVFQKLEEKTARVNDIWYKGDRGNVIDLESLDPQEVKFALFTNVNALTTIIIDEERKEIRRKLVIAENNVDTMSRFNFKLNMYYEFQERCRTRLIEITRNFKNYFFGKEQIYETQNWYILKTEANQKAFIERVGKAIKEAEAFEEGTEKADKELLRIGRSMFSISRDMEQNPSDVASMFNTFKEYLSEVRKAERTVLADKGYTLNDNMEDVLQAFKSERDKIQDEFDKTREPSYIKIKTEEVLAKKEKLQISGGNPIERARDFAKLNYLLEYKASDVEDGQCVLPSPDRKPLKREQNDDKLRLIKLKAKAVKTRLTLLKFKMQMEK
ncbi:DNA (cytosine-5-)-methyltransferase [Fulvivirga sp. 29W222]|uniref:Cytosine-specific methyltransferase n=1 Tax=Fulvivirga marina TaxID=2494733 RepID=A0A937FTL5_9BACT|nr:DNA (cytosine-5-)-methyltransferase [Fulvivirga marina]MBL6445690.1 DNA (cytosine-5-)-methyltransferase [Fulvivirga marina]